LTVGTPEMVIIFVLALLLFGPKKLPELARSVGYAVGEYHKAVREFQQESLRQDFKLDELKKDASISRELAELAREFNISTEKKSSVDILREIKEKTKAAK